MLQLLRVQVKVSEKSSTNGSVSKNLIASELHVHELITEVTAHF